MNAIKCRTVSFRKRWSSWSNLMKLIFWWINPAGNVGQNWWELKNLSSLLLLLVVLKNIKGRIALVRRRRSWMTSICAKISPATGSHFWPRATTIACLTIKFLTGYPKITQPIKMPVSVWHTRPLVTRSSPLEKTTKFVSGTTKTAIKKLISTSDPPLARLCRSPRTTNWWLLHSLTTLCTFIKWKHLQRPKINLRVTLRESPPSNSCLYQNNAPQPLTMALSKCGMSITVIWSRPSTLKRKVMIWILVRMKPELQWLSMMIYKYTLLKIRTWSANSKQLILHRHTALDTPPTRTTLSPQEPTP